MSLAQKAHFFFPENSVLQGGKVLARVPLPKTDPSAQKDCRLQTSFRLKNLKPGEYTFSVRIIADHIYHFGLASDHKTTEKQNIRASLHS